jgi:toxin ParE1/3/4
VHVELHPDARAELRSAALWYDERRSGLGDEFIIEVSVVLDRIGQAPDSYARWPGTQETPPLIRKAPLHQFPYLIAFEKHQRHSLVLAIAHAKRRPLYWLSRASP